MSCQIPEAVLIDLAYLRAALSDLEKDLTIDLRMLRTCDALTSWARLPPSASRHCRDLLSQNVFKLVADIDEDEGLADRERALIELSFWDAAFELRLLDSGCDGYNYVVSRKAKLRETLWALAPEPIDRLLLSWTRLLARRKGPIYNLPGPFAEDVSSVVDALAKLGMPRRAKRIADKFRAPIPPLIQFAIDNRPEYEEDDRLQKTLPRLLRPPLPVPLDTVRTARVLHKVLEPMPAHMPLVVGSKGVVSIGGVAYGAV